MPDPNLQQGGRDSIHCGQRWSAKDLEVYDHDFPSAAEGVGIPYGIYDRVCNQGFISVGATKDTAQFAVASLRRWWSLMGSGAYPHAEEILLLADCGGSNGYGPRLWKYQLQTQFCNRFGLKVRVCHSPRSVRDRPEPNE